MTEPQAPKHQPTPWQPSINPSDGDYSDEQQAASQYDGYYGGSPSTTPAPSGSGSVSKSSTAVPTLKMAYTTAPDLVPYTAAPAGTSSSAPAVADPFTIKLKDLMTAENSCLSAVSACVDDYTTLAGVVNNAVGDGSIFGQDVTTKVTGYTWIGGVDYIPPASDSNADPFDQEGADFANAINPQMQQLLQAVGNTIEAMGTFTALLNNAGQMYTETDSQSAFPPAYLMQGMTNSPATGVTPPPPTSG